MHGLASAPHLIVILYVDNCYAQIQSLLMENNTWVVPLLLAAFVLFGIGDFIHSKFRVRRFYSNKNFEDHGKSDLDQPAQSLILNPLNTTHLYTGEHRGRKIEHCRAHQSTRGKFTLNKLKRRHNQALWSLTRLQSEQSLPSFCVLPKTAPDNMFLLLDDSSIEFENHEEFNNRYNVRCSEPEKIRSLLTETLVDFLMAKEFISLECIDNTVIVKRTWPGEHFDLRFTAELDSACTIVDKLVLTSSK